MLDAALGAALYNVATGDCGRVMTLKTESEALEKRRFKGRHLLWLVYDYYNSYNNDKSLYDYEDMLTVVLKNEGGAREFMRNWDNILMGCRKQPEE